MTTTPQTTATAAATYFPLPLGERKTPSETDRIAEIAPPVIAKSFPDLVRIVQYDSKGLSLTFESRQDFLQFTKDHEKTTFKETATLAPYADSTRPKDLLTTRELFLFPKNTGHVNPLLEQINEIWGEAYVASKLINSSSVLIYQ